MAEKSRSLEFIIGALLLVVFGVAFTLMLRMYYTENDNKYNDVIHAQGNDFLEVRVAVTGVDPIKGELTARLNFEPKGALKGEDGYSVTEDLTIFVNSIKGKQVETLKKGHRPTPLEVTFDIYGDEATDYPFDQHDCDIDIMVTTPEKPKPAEPPPTTPAPAEGTEGEPKPAPKEAPKKDDKGVTSVSQVMEGEPVKLTVLVDAAITGYRISPEKSDQDADIGYIGLDLEIERTPTVKIFSMFILICFWALTITILSLTWAVTFRERKLEFAMFTFMAGMLFAFPAVRNLQPNIPPLGTLTDFLSVFWCQGIIVLCITTLLGIWIFRPAK
ncbi:MAG: DUF4436 domain-containing protein [Blastocatellia bacterium]|nr:DUF4436 domain-containing protein [Blastocatellia bacterium]